MLNTNINVMVAILLHGVVLVIVVCELFSPSMYSMYWLTMGRSIQYFILLVNVYISLMVCVCVTVSGKV